jgi:hypothetical protein
MFTLAGILSVTLSVLIGIVIRSLLRMCCLRRVYHYQRSGPEVPLQVPRGNRGSAEPMGPIIAEGDPDPHDQPPPTYEEAAAANVQS